MLNISFKRSNIRSMTDRFLRQYYPEALKSPCCLNVDVLRINMGIVFGFSDINHPHNANAVATKYQMLDDLSSTNNKGQGLIVFDSKYYKDYKEKDGYLPIEIVVHEAIHYVFHTRQYDVSKLTESDRLMVEKQTKMIMEYVFLPFRVFEEEVAKKFQKELILKA